MDAWWHSLGTVSQAFHLIAFVGTAIVLIQTCLLVLGIGIDDLAVGDLDHGGPGDHAAGLQLLSLRTITAFMAGFGWGGVAALAGGLGVTAAVAIALAAGLALAAAVLWLMRSMRHLASDGSLSYDNAVGQIGTVYLTIPPAAAGTAGKVEVMIQGRLAIAEAVSREPGPLPTGAKVRVVATAGRSTLVVAPC